MDHLMENINLNYRPSSCWLTWGMS